MKRIAVEALPEEPLAAAGLFHQNWLDPIERALAAGQDVTVVMEPADHTHAEWRRAAAAMLARKYAPCRINLISSREAAPDDIAAYLAAAPGVTGQYLEGSV